MPGGFGNRGTRGHDEGRRGRPRATRSRIFGICYGFQWATVEFARNVVRPRRRRLDRVQRGHAAQGDLQAARPARRRRSRRHDAARAVRVRTDARLARAARLRRRPSSTSGTATATSSTPAYEPIADRRTACGSRASRPTASSSRSPNCPDTRGIVAVQFHPEFKSKPLQPASAVRRLRRGELPPQAGAADARRKRERRFRVGFRPRRGSAAPTPVPGDPRGPAAGSRPRPTV